MERWYPARPYAKEANELVELRAAARVSFEPIRFFATMFIRDAIPADAPAIAAIRERTIREIVAPLNLYSPEEIRSWAANFDADRVVGFINQGNYLVAEVDGCVVGFGRFQVDAPDTATIRGIFVDAGWVGRGIGGRIVDRLLALGTGLGITTFDLVATLNARTFYERLGFQFLERVRHTTANGAVIPGLRMRFVVAAK